MKKKTKSKIKTISILSTAFVLIAVCLILTEFYGIARNEKEINIAVPKGATAYDIALILEENELISSKYSYYLYARLTKPLYKHGLHKVNAVSYKDITDALCADDNVVMVNITIPEGYEMKEIAEKLSKEGIVSVEKFYKAADPELYDYWFLENIPKREDSLEGYLFPDTYRISGTESAQEIINMMLANFDRRITGEMRKQAEKSEYTFDEIITLASIIEREAADYNEFPKVAGVFYNRLNKVGESNGYLESCATVQYILKERKNVLSVADTKIDSEYNTYKYPGLPVGPIASPSLTAIKAALYPEKTDYLYFVADGNGRHYFAKDYNTHLQNTKKAGL